jgi:hypothetical protein
MATEAPERTQVSRAAAVGRELFPWRPVLLAWLVSRAIGAFVLMILGARDAPHPDITRLVMWDGQWYKIIAHTGYGTPPIPDVWTPWPFFPLYPGLVRGLVTFGSPYSFAQVALANLATLVALAGVWRLARRHVSTSAASYAVWITALFPGALTFVMGYPDSLYVAGAVWAFILMEDRKVVAAGLAALVATAARPNGFIVVIALAVAVWAEYRGREDRTGLPRRIALLAAPSVAFLIAWCVACWYLTDDPIVFLTAKQAWHEYTLFGAPGHADALMHVALGVILALPFLARIRRQPPSWIVLVALTLLPALALGVVGLARYAVQCFPLAIAAGQTLERATPKLARLALVASAAGLVGYGLLVTKASYVP